MLIMNVAIYMNISLPWNFKSMRLIMILVLGWNANQELFQSAAICQYNCLGIRSIYVHENFGHIFPVSLSLSRIGRSSS